MCNQQKAANPTGAGHERVHTNTTNAIRNYDVGQAGAIECIVSNAVNPYFPNKLHKLMLLTYTEAA